LPDILISVTIATSSDTFFSIFQGGGFVMKTETKTHFLRQPAQSIFLCMLFLSFALTLSSPVRAAQGAERQSRILGDITIEADSIAHSGPNFVARGNITLAVDQGEPVLSVGDTPGGTASL
jgi:hypothetical protein